MRRRKTHRLILINTMASASGWVAHAILFWLPKAPLIRNRRRTFNSVPTFLTRPTIVLIDIPNYRVNISGNLIQSTSHISITIFTITKLVFCFKLNNDNRTIVNNVISFEELITSVLWTNCTIRLSNETKLIIRMEKKVSEDYRLRQHSTHGRIPNFKGSTWNAVELQCTYKEKKYTRMRCALEKKFNRN